MINNHDNHNIKIKNKSTDNLKLGYGIIYPQPSNNDQLIMDFAKKFCCVQIMFSKKNIEKNEIKTLKKITKKYKKIYVHASYQINMGADLIPLDTNLYNGGIDLFLDEIKLAKKINASGIVIHIGKNVSNKYEPTQIYNNMVEFMVELFKKLKIMMIDIPIILETPAGQGGEMCWKLTEFIEFIQRFKETYFYDQIGICIDTCHIFQAGNDINNLKEIKRIHKLFEPLKNKIKLIHLNDSYHKMGSRIDRHEQIGKGQIKTDNLIKFIYPYKFVPMILETIGPYDEQIDKLKFKLN